MTSYVLFLSSFLGPSYSSRPCSYRAFALSTTSLDFRLVATFCDPPLSTYPTHLSLRAAKGTRTRLAPSPPQSPASSPRPSAVPTLSGLIGDLGASTEASKYHPTISAQSLIDCVRQLEMSIGHPSMATAMCWRVCAETVSDKCTKVHILPVSPQLKQTVILMVRAVQLLKHHSFS